MQENLDAYIILNQRQRMWKTSNCLCLYVKYWHVIELVFEFDELQAQRRHLQLTVLKH